MRVSALNTYPVKSCGAIGSQSALLEERGLVYDRRWMIVGATDLIFLTQRSFPRMALIQTALEADSLGLAAPGMDDLRVPFVSPGNEPAPVQARCWMDLCDAIDDGDQAAEWLSTFLRLKCRLVHMRDGFRRPADSMFGPSNAITGFADAYPVLIISESSLDDLNVRMAAPIPMNRFRPNIVVQGCEPYAEDRWKRIRIGEVEFEVKKPCVRCVITTIDQTTGEKTGPEPLQTLATYRKEPTGVIFGQNVINRSGGRISVGESIEVLE